MKASVYKRLCALEEAFNPPKRKITTLADLVLWVANGMQGDAELSEEMAWLINEAFEKEGAKRETQH